MRGGPGAPSTVQQTHVRHILIKVNQVVTAAEAHRKLVEQFSSRQVHKTYLALVHNWPKMPEGMIDDPIGRDPRNRTRMSITGIDARTAVSHYKVIERLLTPYGRLALLEVRIETGRTHQIRVHMASIGHPVVGDTLYGAAGVLRSSTAPRKGSRKRNAAEREAGASVPETQPGALRLNRNFLHAAAVELTHPRTGKALSFTAPLPVVLTSFLEKLRGPQQI